MVCERARVEVQLLWILAKCSNIRPFAYSTKCQKTVKMLKAEEKVADKNGPKTPNSANISDNIKKIKIHTKLVIFIENPEIFITAL